MVDYTLPPVSDDPGDPDVWGEEVTDAFGAFDVAVEAPRAVQALRSWRAALAGRWTAPVRVVAIGSSTTAGVGATALDRRYIDRLGQLLHARFNPPGVVGGRWIGALDTGWATSGTVTTVSRGLSLQSRALTAGATMSRTINPCTSITVLYEQGPGAGQFSVSVDGGGATTITPDTTGTANRHDGSWSSSLVSVGSHAFAVTALGDCVISGVYAHNGDESSGVQLYGSGLSGAVTSDFAGGAGLTTRIASLGTALCLVMLAANEYANGTNPATIAGDITGLLDGIKAAAYPPPSFQLLGTYRRLDVAAPAYPWQAYLDIQRELAAADPVNIAYADIGEHWPATSGVDHWNVLDADLVHSTDRGHALLADLVEQALRSPRLAGMSVHTPALTATAPDEVSGLLAWYDADTLAATLSDGNPVSSWAPAAGSETAPLTQSGSARPTWRAAAVGGRSAVRFAQASSQNLDSGAWATSHPVPITVLAVAQFGTSATAMNWWTGRTGVFTYLAATPTAIEVGAGGTGQLFNREPADTGWHIVAAVFNGATSRIYWDSRTFTVRGTTGTSGSAAMPGIRLGTNSGASSNFLNGDIASVAVYGRALTAVEVSRLVAWAADRYSLEVA